jgi:glycine/D-amino acid oxidase-like deaminating enzyme/nitrite reductase/ring-hydroxylating ferredoxin subunit
MAESIQDNAFPYPVPSQESATKSVWIHTAERQGLNENDLPPVGSLTESISAEVAIVGAGITGITLALLLQKSGVDVVVLDANPVGYGVSGLNSGHLTTMLLDLKFKNIISAFGEDATRAVTLGLAESLDLIEQFVSDYRLDCDFKRLSGYLYTEKSSELAGLQEEFDCAAKAGLQVNRTFNVPLPFAVEEAVQVSNQAIFHPLKYVQGLAQAFKQNGGRIFEHSRVLSVGNETTYGGIQITTESGAVSARDVVLATHTPIGFRPASQTRLEAYRSYIIGFRTDDPVGDALFWDTEEPYHYMRMVQDEQGPLIILGGEDHRTGERRDTERCFQNLESYARTHFNLKSVDYRWSAQLYNPADNLPYIGKLSEVYIATGYSGEGLTFGTLAAQIIHDELVGRHNNCSEILSPSRTKPLAAASGFLAENMGTLAHFVGDRLRKAEVSDPQQIPVGEGAICSLEGNKVAIYHGSEGVFHYLSPVCTHMNCIVGWNSAEKSWDCPCHGARFDASGHVLNGPAVVDLKPVSPDGD